MRFMAQAYGLARSDRTDADSEADCMRFCAELGIDDLARHVVYGDDYDEDDDNDYDVDECDVDDDDDY